MILLRLILSRTGAADGSSRQPFTGRQVISHVSRAFYAAAALQEKHPADQVAIALPDDARHRAAIELIGTAIAKLAVVVYFVAGDGATSPLRTR